MALTPALSDNPVLHVVVIGFHHKKGCQIDYSYPPLIAGGEVNSNECPTEWKHLPSLAVPDGAHNFVKDTIYFHLPAREGTHRTVYGVACYRQIDSSDLKNKTTDITRSTVQKSVCVLSSLPLYGLIQAKLELITHAYFKELDFSQVSLLEETYKNMNLSLTTSLLDGGSQVYLGMEIKDVVQHFKHKIMVLFKLILLERRVLFTGSPVESLGNTLLAVLSLFPGMIEHGLIECTAYGVHKAISPTMKSKIVGEDGEEFLEIRYSDQQSPELRMHSPVIRCNSEEPESPTIERGDKLSQSNRTDGKVQSSDNSNNQSDKNQNDIVKSCVTKLDYVEDHYSDNSSQSKPVRGTSNGSDCVTSDKVPGTNIVSHDSSSHDKQQILLAENSMIMMGVTQYEAVQAGKSIPKNGSVINMEDVSKSIEMDEDYFGSISERATIGSAPGDLSISLEDVDESHYKDISGIEDSIEELDSPESIDQIDQEDCFSWEEERLSLTIDVEENPQNLDDNAGLASSFKEISLLEKNNMKSHPKLIQSNSVEQQGTDNPKVVKETSNTSKESSRESSPAMKASAIKSRLSNAFSGISLKQKLRSKPGSRENSEPPSPTVSELPMERNTILELPILHQDEFGFPLAVFTQGSVCFPYLSLQYFDLLNDVNIRSFVIGATNILFRQKRHLTDAVIDINECKLEIHDKELQRQLTLTTADLRFADILVKAVTGMGDDMYLDGTEWEGNAEWLRAQFRLYLESLLATSLLDDPKLVEDYGNAFVQAWKTTHNYRVWASKPRSGMTNVQPGHPCQGHLGVADIKMRLSQSNIHCMTFFPTFDKSHCDMRHSSSTNGLSLCGKAASCLGRLLCGVLACENQVTYDTMQNTEGGKKINAAVTQTGKYVMQTGKAVGGALNQAKSSLSSWFSSWKASDKVSQASPEEMTDKTPVDQ